FLSIQPVGVALRSPTAINLNPSGINIGVGGKNERQNRMNQNHFLVKPGAKIKLKDFDHSYTGKFNSPDEAAAKLEKDVARLRKYQDILYAQNTYALLIIFQAM